MVQLHFICLLSAVRQDLAIWGKFLERYNGHTMLMDGPVSNRDLELYTNTSGAHSFGAYFQGEWCA